MMIPWTRLTVAHPTPRNTQHVHEVTAIKQAQKSPTEAYARELLKLDWQLIRLFNFTRTWTLCSIVYSTSLTTLTWIHYPNVTLDREDRIAAHLT